MTRVRGTRFCPSCSRLVVPTKRFVIRAFIAWLVFGVGVGGVAYLLWYAVKPRVRCSLCRAPTLKRVPKGYALNPNGHGIFSPRGDGAPLHTPPAEAAAHVDSRPAAAVPVTAPPPAALEVAASRCPACAYPVVEGVKRPIRVTCPECGAAGHLVRKK